MNAEDETRALSDVDLAARIIQGTHALREAYRRGWLPPDQGVDDLDDDEIEDLPRRHGDGPRNTGPEGQTSTPESRDPWTVGPDPFLERPGPDAP